MKERTPGREAKVDAGRDAGRDAGVELDGELTDGALVERCRDRRQALAEAFSELYRRHADAVFRFLISMLRDRAQAEDCLQEAFFRAYNALERYDTARPFRPWVFRIARNVALDQLRKGPGAVELHETTEAAATREDPTEAASRRERRELVHEALDALPDEERSVLVMRHFHGMTSKQIAEVLSCSLRTAKTRLKGAALMLGRELSRRAITSPEVV